MILIITNSNDKTSDYIEEKITIPYFRLNTDHFISRYIINYSEKYFDLYDKKNKKEISYKTLNGIIYRRPVNPIIDLDEGEKHLEEYLAQEARTIYEFLFSSINTKWMSFPDKIRAAENKIIQLRIAKKNGFRIPDYIISNSYERTLSSINKKKNYCVKPMDLGIFMKEGTNYIPYTSIVSDYEELQLLDNYPTYLQEYVDKKYEYRVIVIGENAISVRIDSQNNKYTKIDWRVNNCMLVDYESVKLPTEILNKCINIVKDFGINFSSMDLIENKAGDFYFLDLNPNGQWAWLDEILNLKIMNLIESFFYEDKL